MSSSPISVSLCVIRVEIVDEDSEESNGKYLRVSYVRIVTFNYYY